MQSSSDGRVRGWAIRCSSPGYDLGVAHDGGYSEYVRVPADWVVPVPAGLTLFETMAIGTAGFTAALSVVDMERNGLTPSSGPVIVTGATGGVGTLGIQLLAARGYQVTALSGKDEGDYLRSLGAREVLSRQTLQMGTKPLEKALWAGAVDPVGGETLAWLTRTMNYGGTIASSGLLAAPICTLRCCRSSSAASSCSGSIPCRVRCGPDRRVAPSRHRHEAGRPPQRGEGDWIRRTADGLRHTAQRQCARPLRAEDFLVAIAQPRTAWERSDDIDALTQPIENVLIVDRVANGFAGRVETALPNDDWLVGLGLVHSVLRRLTLFLLSHSGPPFIRDNSNVFQQPLYPLVRSSLGAPGVFLAEPHVSGGEP